MCVNLQTCRKKKKNQCKRKFEVRVVRTVFARNKTGGLGPPCMATASSYWLCRSKPSFHHSPPPTHTHLHVRLDTGSAWGPTCCTISHEVEALNCKPKKSSAWVLFLFSVPACNFLHVCFPERYPATNATALTNLILDVLVLESEGQIEWHGAVPPRWSYARSVYFALSVITTIGEDEMQFDTFPVFTFAPSELIVCVAASDFRQPCNLSIVGFGNIILKTSLGRCFSVLYAIVGIPLSALLYVEIGSHLNDIVHSMVLVTYRITFPRGDKLSPKGSRIITAFVVLVIGIIFVIMLPGLIITTLEDEWNYGESCYFAFTTITTIGFGDYVAGGWNVSGARHPQLFPLNVQPLPCQQTKTPSTTVNLDSKTQGLTEPHPWELQTLNPPASSSHPAGQGHTIQNQTTTPPLSNS